MATDITFGIKTDPVATTKVDSGALGNTSNSTSSGATSASLDTGNKQTLQDQLAIAANDKVNGVSLSSGTSTTTQPVTTSADTNQLESSTNTNVSLPNPTEPQKIDVSSALDKITAQAGAIQNTLDQNKEQYDLQATQAKASKDLNKAFDSLSSLGKFESGVADSVELQKKKELKTEIDNKIMRKSRDFDLALRAAEDTFGTRAQKNAVKAEITKNYNRELADLSIIQMARAGEYNDAKAYVDQKVQLELQDRQNNLNKLMFFYQENKERLSLLDQRAFQAKIVQEERAYQEEYQKRMQLEEVKANLVINAAEYGAGNMEMQKLMQAESLDQLMSMPNAAKYLMPKAEREMQAIQLASARAMRSAGGSTGNPSADIMVEAGVLGTDADPMLSKMAATAGGRLLTQSEVEPLTNSMRVIDGLQDLKGAIGNTNTDPIIGFFRSMNPYDLKASQIDAAITQLVPQLARGTYGEVGVLTDTDMARYSGTLPNLTSTEAQNKAIMALTLRKVRSGFVSQLSAMESAGRDVSGFVDDYQALNSTINQLEADIGVGSDANANFDAEFDSLSNATQQSEGGFFRSIGKFLFGS